MTTLGASKVIDYHPRETERQVVRRRKRDMLMYTQTHTRLRSSLGSLCVRMREKSCMYRYRNSKRINILPQFLNWKKIRKDEIFLHNSSFFHTLSDINYYSRDIFLQKESFANFEVFFDTNDSLLALLDRLIVHARAFYAQIIFTG